MKYIVDIPEGYIPVRAKDKSLVFPGNPKFRTYEKELEDIRKNQYVLLQHDVEEALRNEGRKEVWAIVQTLISAKEDGGFSNMELREMFGTVDPLNVISNYDPDDVIRIIAEHKSRFRVGDIIVLRDVNQLRGVVTNVEKYADTNEVCYGVLFEDGMHGSFCSDDLEKTKEHVDLSDIFAKLKGEK